MFSKVLDCPECKHRFNFDHSGDDFPERITCPECKTSRVYSEYSAMTLCSQCRAKLKIPLDILFDEDLSCPNCGVFLNAHGKFTEDTAASTITNNAADRRQLYKRMLKDGDVFDKYQIIRLLGKGGMAEVYLAEHLLLKQKCAVKLMRANIGGDDEMAVKRFLREAKLSHQFNHPNIVKVFDVGSDFQTGYLFIAMEYVEGKTLHDLAKEQPFTEEQLNAVLVSMANALNELMAVRVVHRDIKPSNIMLTNDGVYKLMDLGIAKSESNNHVAGDMTLTLEQSTIGTPNYASPEQCRSAHNVDYRSDIYSLGATLYHLASGKLPFTGTTAVETILNVMQTEAVPLKSFRPDLSDKMIGLIEQMMRKNPAERPQLPDALLAAIYSSGQSKAKGLLRKISNGVKKMFISKSQGENSSPAGKWKLIKNIIRWTAAAALIVVILINFKHISNVYKKDRNLQEYVKGSDPEKNPRQTQIKKRDYFASMHPLMTFPDECGDLSKKSSTKRYSAYIYPTVKFAADNKSDLILDYDFSDGSFSEQQFDPQLLKDGMADLSEQEYEKTTGKGIKYKAYKHATVPLSAAVNDFTLSLDFCTNDSGDTPVFNIGSTLSAAVIKNRFVIFTSGSYYANTSFTIPNNNWANITLIYDYSKRKLTLLSGDRLLGCYLLSYGFSWNNLSLGYSRLARIQVDGKAGKFDRIRVYDCARELILPEDDSAIERNLPVTGSRQEVADFKVQVAAQAKAVSNASTENTANRPEPPAAETQTSTPAATVSDSSSGKIVINDSLSKKYQKPVTVKVELPSGSGKTINQRYDECRGKLRQLMQSPNQAAVSAQIKLLEEQIKTLEEQKEIRRKINAAKRRRYSRNKTNAFKSELEAYLTKSYNRGTFNELMEKLKDPAVDPNIVVDNPYKGRYSNAGGDKVTLWELAERNNHFDRTPAIQVLKERFADPEFNGNPNIYHATALIFGMENVDFMYGNKPVLFHCANPSYFRDVLRLAPQINGVVDQYGRNLMHYAVLSNSIDMGELLLAAGFTDGRKADNNHITPWQMALHLGAGNMKEFLEKNGLKTADTPADHLQFELWQSAISKDHNKVKECLKKGADPYLTNHNSFNLVAVACSQDDVNLLKLLINCGVDISRVNTSLNSTYSPLMVTISRGNTEIFDLLLKNNISANIYIYGGTNRNQRLVNAILGHSRNAPAKLLQVLKNNASEDEWNGEIREAVWKACQRWSRSSRSGELIADLLKIGVKVTESDIKHFPRNSTIRKTLEEAIDTASEEEEDETAANTSTAQSTASTTAFTAPENLPAGDSLADQLKRSRMRRDAFVEHCKKLRAELPEKVKDMPPANAAVYREILDCADYLAAEWQKRLIYLQNRNRKIAAVKSRSYSSNMNRRLQQEFQEYTTRKLSYGYNSKDVEMANKFLEMLKNEKVDPNLYLVDGRYSQHSGPALRAISSGRIAREESIQEVLCNRYADPSSLEYNSDVSQKLIAYGLPEKVVQRKLDNSFPRYYVRKNLVERCKYLFLDGGKFTAILLHNAVKLNDPELVKLMLAAGADPNAVVYSNGETALFAACRIPDNLKIRRLLLAAGCRTDITNHQGKKAADYTHISKFTKYWKSGNINQCRNMLSNGIDPNMKLADGSTLLMDAAKRLDLAQARLLLSFKCRVDEEGSNGNTALQEAFNHIKNYRSNSGRNKAREAVSMVKLLVEAGADVSKNPDDYGGKSLNYLWYLTSNCTERNMDIYAKLIDFMLDHTKNFSNEHWRSIPFNINRLPKRFPRAVKSKLQRAIPADLRRN